MDYFAPTNSSLDGWSNSNSNSNSNSSSVTKNTTATKDKNNNKKTAKGKVSKGMKLSTDPQSVAARERRHRISDRFKILQSLVPGGTKMDTVSMLEEAICYVKFLKSQIWLHQNMFNFVDDDEVVVDPSMLQYIPAQQGHFSGGYGCGAVQPVAAPGMNVPLVEYPTMNVPFEASYMKHFS